jgi:protein-S-isoprenylcysteine O-methyltransferase Ste14
MKNKIPPPILLLITGVIMWAVSQSEFAYPVSIPYPLALAISLAAIGIVIAAIAGRQFGIAQTTVNPLSPEKATSLVSTGIFGLSRNPMYVGLLLMSLGWAVWLGSLTNIVVIALFVFVITSLQIKPEEKAMRSLFGDDYEDYCRRVRRWI